MATGWYGGRIENRGRRMGISVERSYDEWNGVRSGGRSSNIQYGELNISIHQALIGNVGEFDRPKMDVGVFRSSWVTGGSV